MTAIAQTVRRQRETGYSSYGLYVAATEPYTKPKERHTPLAENERSCVICGKRFPRTRRGPRKYCCEACRKTGTRRIVAEWNRKHQHGRR